MAFKLGSPARPCPNYILPKHVAPGHCLAGTITFAKSDLGKKAENLIFTYVIAELPPKQGGNKSKPKKEEAALDIQMKEEERDMKISWISKHKQLDLFEELVNQWPDHVPVYVAKLTTLDNSKTSERRNEEIIATADEIISKIDVKTLSANLGLKFDPRTDAATIKADTEKQKNWLVTALIKKGCALLERILDRQTRGKDEEMQEGPTRRDPSPAGRGSPLPLSKSAGSDAEETARGGLEIGGGVSKHVVPYPPADTQIQISGDQSNTVAIPAPPLGDFQLNSDVKNLQGTYHQLQMFVDIWDPKMLGFMFQMGMAFDRFGIALKALSKMQEEKETQENEQLCIQVCKRLNWNHVARHLSDWLPAKFPPGYTLF